MQTKLDHMRTFKVVAETGSLSDAAEILNRTPSAISMSLKQFTELLGNELFETDRKSNLTPFGHFVLEHARKALHDFDESMVLIHRYARGNYGSVRIAAVPSFSTRLLPTIINKFTQQQTDVHIEIRDMDSATINQAVANGEVDLGIASQAGQIHDLSTELLFEENYGVICRSDHHLVKCKSIKLKQLLSEKFIANNLVKSIEHTTVMQLVQNSKLHIHNIVSLYSFIEQGFGLTLLPRSAMPDNQKIAYIPLVADSIRRQLFIIQHSKQRLNPAANKLREFIVNHTRQSKQ